MNRKVKILLAAALLISVAATAMVYAERGGRGFGDRLTEEQREAIHAKVEEMRTAGASRDEIHEAVREMLEGYGITPPERPPEGHGPGGHFRDQLTEEQREAIHAKVEEMRTAGASRDEIHEAVREMLEGYGITPPERPPEGHGPGGHFRDQLTEEQRQAIRARIREMREAGASHDEIHEAVREMLSEFGIEIPGSAEAGEASSQPSNLGENPGEGARWGEVKGRFE
jgi:DNA-binding transcriptional regulator YhcF (GntR family)